MEFDPGKAEGNLRKHGLASHTRALLAVIRDKKPQSIAELAELTGRAPPNLTRTLGGADGWTTPFLVQSAGATNVKVSWYRFSDGSLVTTQNLALTANSALRVDPRGIPALSDDTQYSVVLDGGGQNIAAIVTELNYSGGDGAMIYAGFPPCLVPCRP